MLCRCAVLLLCLHAAWADRDKISFPEDISSPFVTRPEAASEQYRRAVKALFEIVLRLKRVVTELEGQETNFVVSPLCIATAMGQLLLGARGNTRRRLADMLTPLSGAQLDEQFHRELGELLRYLQHTGFSSPDYELDVGGAFFVQVGLHLRESFRYSVNTLYGSDVIPTNFTSDPRGSQRRVNAWASDHTRGHISTILPHPLPGSTAALLASSVYFRGTWETPFDPDINVIAHFHLNASHTVPVTLMRNSFEMLYGRNAAFSLVALPYLHKQAAMFIVLPNSKDKDIGEFLSELSLEELHKVIASMDERVVNFAMPRMKLSTTFSLREPLARLHKIKKEQEQRNKLRIFDESLVPNSTNSKLVCNAATRTCKYVQIDSAFVNSKFPENNSLKDSRGHNVLQANNSRRNNTISVAHLRRVKKQVNHKNRTTENRSHVGTRVGNNSETTGMSHRYVNYVSRGNHVSQSTSRKTTMLPSPSPTVFSKPTTTNPLTSTSTKANSHGIHDPDVRLDMTGASEDSRFRVDDIINQAWLDISETGTEAAAVAASTLDYSGDSEVFLVNRPFLFFIRHEVTLAPLFWGVIADPTSGSAKASHMHYQHDG